MDTLLCVEIINIECNDNNEISLKKKNTLHIDQQLHIWI